MGARLVWVRLVWFGFCVLLSLCLLPSPFPLPVSRCRARALFSPRPPFGLPLCLLPPGLLSSPPFRSPRFSAVRSLLWCWLVLWCACPWLFAWFGWVRVGPRVGWLVVCLLFRPCSVSSVALWRVLVCGGQPVLRTVCSAAGSRGVGALVLFLSRPLALLVLLVSSCVGSASSSLALSLARLPFLLLSPLPLGCDVGVKRS